MTGNMDRRDEQGDVQVKKKILYYNAAQVFENQR